MQNNAFELFNKNYNNEGMCSELKKFVKTFDKKYKSGDKSITYLPWATVERIFRLQGGVVEVVDWNCHIDFEGEETNIMTGEIEKKTSKALFIKLRGTWQGETLEELYPIFDSQTSRVVKIPDANQLNASRQRGMVKLIARLSGIGLWLFEQTDLQFDEEVKVEKHEEEHTPQPTKKPTTKAKPKKENEISKSFDELIDKANETKEEVDKAEAKEKEINDSLFNMLAGDVVKKEKPQVELPQVEEVTYSDDSEETSNLKLKLKSYVPTHREQILKFRDSVGKQTLDELSYNELTQILKQIEG